MSAEIAVSVLLERRWCLGLIRIRTSPAIRALGGQQFLSILDTDGIGGIGLDEKFGDVGDTVGHSRIVNSSSWLAIGEQNQSNSRYIQTTRGIF